ncbi:MAG: SHOCT domain-containing protein [bacterium]|nr:SHOCT domain-containing protein [bacterium]
MFVSSAEDDENKNQGGIDIKTQSNKTELIIKYHNLFKEGIISEEEFEKKKKELL